MLRWSVVSLLAATILSGGCAGPETGTDLPGTLEADRIDLRADAAERILAQPTREGDTIAAGDLVLQLDATRANLRLAVEQADLDRVMALRDEVVAGSRREDLRQARAQQESVAARSAQAKAEYDRAQQLRARGLLSSQDLDRARRSSESLAGELAAARAAYERLAAGSRDEQVAAAQAAVAAAEARLAVTRHEISRHEIRAPRAGRLDVLPFRAGDQPRVGDVVASIVIDGTAHARVYVPARWRAALSPGQSVPVAVSGLAVPLEGRVRSIASEAAFTPYFALHGDDAERLSYLVEVALPEAVVADLPLGVPVTVRVERRP